MNKKNTNFLSEIKLNKNILFSIYFCTFLVSLTLIFFELITTRISSLVFINNYSFLIISLAIFGIGLGAIFVHITQRNTKIETSLFNHINNYLTILSLSIFIFIMLISAFKIFINPILFFLLTFIPFFISGIILSKIFQIFADNSYRIYFFDLLGAAIGSILAIISINLLGAANSLILVAIIILLFSISIYLRKQLSEIKRYWLKSIILSIFMIVLITVFIFNFFIVFPGQINIAPSEIKDEYLILKNTESPSKIIETGWSSFGRTDLVEVQNNPEVKFLFIDGAAGTPMFKFDGSIENASEKLSFLKLIYSGNFPFYFLQSNQKDDMLIIGPGGGREVILGLVYKIKNITGLEINNDFINIVKEYSEYNGGIYRDFENVIIINTEARSFINKDKSNYDIILMAQPFTKSSRSFEGYVLTENYLLTSDAISSYFDHLTKEGMLIVVLHNKEEIMRFITSILTSLGTKNINNKDAMQYFYTIGREINPVIVLKKTKITEEESKIIYDNMVNLNLFSPNSYIPFIEQKKVVYKNDLGQVIENNLFDTDLIRLAKGEIKLEQLTKLTPYNSNPVTDNKPFFFNNEKGIPKNIIPIFIIALILNFFLLLIFFVIGKKNKGIPRLIILFSLIGFGFIIIEIIFFQKFILFLEQPMLALAVTLSSLLFGMGIGSYFANKIFKSNSQKRLMFSSLIIFLLSLTFFYVFQTNFKLAFNFDILYKVLISVIIFIVFGFFLGMPFPTGIKIAKNINQTKFVAMLYGVNGTMSILGSVSAIIISSIFGFQIAIIVGSFCYLIVFFIFLISILTKR